MRHSLVPSPGNSQGSKKAVGSTEDLIDGWIGTSCVSGDLVPSRWGKKGSQTEPIWSVFRILQFKWKVDAMDMVIAPLNRTYFQDIHYLGDKTQRQVK